MIAVINGKGLGGDVDAIQSKSQAHRLLICAALADSDSSVICPSVNEDIQATVRCLNALGADIKREMDGYSVKPIGTRQPQGILDCGESGSTLRFLLPVVCALGINATFTGEGRLPKRPMDELCDALVKGGAHLDSYHLPISVSGKLTGGDYEIPHDVSSQYISGLMFALPLLSSDSRIVLDGIPESNPYIRMTRSALRQFGINTEDDGRFGFYIKGRQRYSSCGNVFVEGDWSNAAFWLCCGAIGNHQVSVRGLDMDSAQGDRRIVDILKDFGADVSVSDTEITVNPSKLHAVQLDAKDIPDLVPVISVVASVASGDTRIYNASRLRLKESDRIKSTAKMLRSLGAQVKELEDGLVIKGGTLKGGTVDTFNDHRIAMAASVASSACDDDITVIDAQAVNKSYPAFFSDYTSLGGHFREV